MDRADSIQRRVARLQEGKGHPADFDHILLWLRARSFGNKIIRDLGDFIGHPDGRDQGRSSERLTDLHAMAAFHLPRITLTKDQLRALDPKETKVRAVAAANAALRLYDDKDFRAACGVSKKAAQRTLKGMFDNLEFKDGYTVEFKSSRAADITVLDRLLKTLVVNAGFSKHEMGCELEKSLRSNKLIGRDEKLQSHVVDRLTLFAVAKLHRSIIHLPCKRTAQLSATYDPTSELKSLVVNSTFNEKVLGDVEIAFSFFDTNLPYETVCEKELRLSDEWPYDVEVNAAWKLQMV